MTRVDFMQGNDASAEGGIAAGCRFLPDTRSPRHLKLQNGWHGASRRLAGHSSRWRMEIASMAAVIGGAWTGVRSMTATSGPGFSLMMENIGYAAFTETPCVVVNIQRGGPSTGQPTLAAQGDMLQCRFGSHGGLQCDRPVAIKCSGDVRSHGEGIQPGRSIPCPGLSDGR